MGVVTPWKSANTINKNFLIQRPDLPTYTIRLKLTAKYKGVSVCVCIKGGGERETERESAIIKSLGVVNI